jgi:hypothetical protein
MHPLLLLFCFLLITGKTNAQDKVYTWQGDSIEVNIPGDPWRALRINYTNLGQSRDYGFSRIAVIYGKDSIRIHSPFQISGFYRKSLGKHLGSGYFESTIIYEQQLFWHARQRQTLNGTPNRVFRQLILRHPDLSIWHFRKNAGYNLPSSYYFFETAADSNVFVNYKEWKNWASMHPPFDGILSQLPKPSKRTGGLFGYFERVAKKYNSLKP